MSNKPLWLPVPAVPEFPALSQELDVDVAIVGGGISGMTAAALLSESGLRTAVLELDRIGSGETGHTTSHLTEAVDGRYSTLIKTFGEDGARLVADASRASIARIQAFVSDLRIDCGFERVPGYLYTEKAEQMEWLADELDAARRSGCAVEWIDRVPLAFMTHGGIRWDNQAQMNPTAYLAGLARKAMAGGVQIYERTRVTGITDGEPCSIETSDHVVTAGHVFVAANVAINNRVFLHTKVAPYRSYAIASEAGPGHVNGLFWDTEDPYHYTRMHTVDGRLYLIVGGEDHRTGEDADTAERYERLIAYARERFGVTTAQHRWSGQIIEPVDGLPFIGVNTGSRNVYVATGFSGNGMTFGTLAGMMAADFAQGRANPYSEVFDATRVKPLASAVNYVTENAPFALHLAKDRLTSANATLKSAEQLKPGEGGILATEDGKLAVCRDAAGVLHALSPVCPHLGCDVAWNGAEKSWDCPCHGSRFTAEGKVINGPAVSDLPSKPLPVGRAG